MLWVLDSIVPTDRFSRWWWWLRYYNLFSPGDMVRLAESYLLFKKFN
jgi:hypothetical protein